MGNGELASLAYGSLKELLKIESLLLEGASPPGGGCSDDCPIVFGVVLRPSFAPVFDRHFHGSFSVGDRPGNCLFHWVFCDFGQLLSVLGNSGSKCRLS